LWDDSKVQDVFDKYKEAHGRDQASGPSLSGQKLIDALKELGIALEEPGPEHAEDLEDFKRIARQPSDTELWMQTMPMANILARSFRNLNLKQLEKISEEEVLAGFQVFSDTVKEMFKLRLTKLRKQKEKLQALPSDDSKFGGYLEGGNVDEFHRGIAERLGESL